MKKEKLRQIIVEVFNEVLETKLDKKRKLLQRAQQLTEKMKLHVKNEFGI